MTALAVLLGAMVWTQAGADQSEAKRPPAVEAELAGQVRRLVRQLDAPELSQREAAEAELLRLGPKVLHLLPREADPSRPELVERLNRIREHLQRAVSASVLQPSTVTLHGRMPLSKILAAIATQTGNRIVGIDEGEVPAGGPELAVDFDKTPFWQALDTVLTQAGLSAYFYGSEKAVAVVPRKPGEAGAKGRAFYSGPFRFEPTAVVAQRDLRRGTAWLRVEVEIAWEPRLAPITFQQKMSEVQAFDEQGNRLEVEQIDADREIPIEPERLAKELTLPLRLPPRSVRQIARLKGKLHVLVPGATETFRFANLAGAKNVQQRASGVTVTLEQVRRNKKIWEVYLAVRFGETHGALASHRTWISANPAYLEGPDGKRIEGNAETTRHTAAEVGIMYLFYVEDPIEKYTFVYQTPGMIFSQPFEYELQNIDLP